MGIQKLGIEIAENIVKSSRKAISQGESIGFARLKGLFTSGQNYRCYDELLLNAKNKIMGNIPKEIIDIITKLNPTTKSEAIKSAQNAFGNIAKTLKEVELVEINALKNMATKEDEIHFLLKELFSGLKLNGISDGSVKVIQKANENFSKTISAILQTNCKTSLEFIGNGQFGNAYKLSLLDEAGNSIIHSRVIKVFKDDLLNAELAALKHQKVKELLLKYTDDELFEIYKTIPTKQTSKIKFAFKVSDEQKKRTFLSQMLNQRGIYGEMNVDNLQKDFLKQLKEMKDTHGLYAEANSTFRLKNILGHNISKTNAVNTDMYDLDIGYSISQFSDDLLPKTTSKISFERLGLDYGDEKTANYVANRLIDFGGITKTTEDLVDKITLRYYKKIMNRNNKNEQLELIRRLKQLIQNPKTPHREKIKKAVDLAEYSIVRGK
ncbi:hypothetical protein IJ384_03280 [bacterium]|nr:hypothetical protein [bacterium]